MVEVVAPESHVCVCAPETVNVAPLPEQTLSGPVILTTGDGETVTLIAARGLAVQEFVSA